MHEELPIKRKRGAPLQFEDYFDLKHHYTLKGGVSRKAPGNTTENKKLKKSKKTNKREKAEETVTGRNPSPNNGDKASKNVEGDKNTSEVSSYEEKSENFEKSKPK